MKRVAVACTILGGAHLTLVLATGTARPEHLVADALLAIFPWLGARPRAFAAGGLWLALGGVLYDSQRWLLPLRAAAVQTGALRDLDLTLFPAPGGVTWPEVFARHHTPIVDVLTSVPYGTHIFEVFAGAIVLFFVDRAWFQRLCVAFFLSIVAGVALYLLLPAAPPWYVLAHGPGPADLGAAASAAGTARVDALLGMHYFADFYRRNANVFGAIPSLHATFPLLVAWALGRQGRIFRAVTMGWAVLVSFGAIYLVHHWVLDVVLGWGVAAVACYGAQRAFGATPNNVPCPHPLRVDTPS